MPKRIPQLDAVRGIAILVVIVHNSGALPRLFANGWMGVDLFFALSGFLITGILIDSKASENYFRNFYIRRCLRIWPLYYSLLFFMFVMVPIFRPSDAHNIFARSSPWWAYPLFLQNFLIAIPTMASGALAVTWSLAVEEQFYVVWPWIIRYCSLAQVRRIAIAVICLSPVLRFYLTLHGVNIYSNLFCRLDGLMAGALLAITVRKEDFVPSRFIRSAWIAFCIAAPFAFATEALNARWIGFSFTAVAATAFIYLAIYSAQKWLQAVMTNRFLVYTGTISYGLYLLHKIPFDAAQALHLNQHSLLVLPIAIMAAYVLAALSWNLLEKPFLRRKQFFESKPRRPDVAPPQLVVRTQEDVTAA
jgi:peptidoglycan/LPS O-acetylase OafA/YrhL